MDGVLCDYVGAHNKATTLCPSIKYPQSQYGFFRNLKPLPNAIEAFSVLFMHADVYILTAPSVKNPLSYSEKREWVETHLGVEVTEKLIMSPNKGLSKGDYLIDDMISGKGQDKFEGKLIHFGSDEFPNWNKVLEYFKKELNI